MICQKFILLGYTLLKLARCAPLELVFAFWNVPFYIPTLMGRHINNGKAIFLSRCFLFPERRSIMKIGYIRVSTQEQNTLRQEVLMESLGVDQVFIDRMSGKNIDRPELKRMMQFVRQGDTVIVESISRFARNTKDLLDLVEQLIEKDVEFISKKEAIDTSTPTGKFMLTIFGAVAELEREYILQRQKEGIAIAKTQGKYKGRKSKVHPNTEKVMKKWQNGEITAVAAMKALNISKSTFYRITSQYIHK